jgi:hypothetical protein
VTVADGLVDKLPIPDGATLTQTTDVATVTRTTTTVTAPPEQGAPVVTTTPTPVTAAMPTRPQK